MASSSPGPAVITINTPALSGGVTCVGGRISSLDMKRYRTTTEESSPHVTLFCDHGLTPYYPQTGWIGGTGVKDDWPDEQTLWSTEDTQLTPDHPVTLTWTNPRGAVFKRTFRMDDEAIIFIQDTIENTTDTMMKGSIYSCIRRKGPCGEGSSFVLHEGFVGVLNDALKEISHADLKSDPLTVMIQQPSWFGFTDKYWMTALIPQANHPVTMHAYGHGDWHQVDFSTTEQTVQPGQHVSYETRVFAGAKVLSKLDAYEPILGIPKFDLAIDFGVFYFLTKPLFKILQTLKEYFGSFGLAILILTVFVKGLFFPLANKSYRSMGKMKALQPQIEKLKAQYGDDRMAMNQALMELYKKNSVNPMAGCLPMFVQIPVFFALYKVLFVSIEMRHAPFFGWIHDLSAPDPSNLLTLFGLLNWSPPHFLHIGVWPLFMGGSMLLQQRMSPQPADPMQQKMMMFLPLIFIFSSSSFPAGLVIYWTWSNILSIAQQSLISYLEKRKPKLQKA